MCYDRLTRAQETMLNAIFGAPVAAAFSATAFLTTIALTDPPQGSFYMPILFEVFIFPVAYVIFSCINLVAIIPTCFLLLATTKKVMFGWVYSIVAALAVTQIILATGLVPNEPHVTDRDVMGMFVVPLVIVAIITYYRLRRRELDRATSSASQGEEDV